MLQEIQTHCPSCGSEDVYAITRVTGYFSKTSMWNKGKIGEFKRRHREGGFKKIEEDPAEIVPKVIYDGEYMTPESFLSRVNK